MHETDEQIYAIDHENYVPVFARYDIVLDHGDGVYVYDTHGKKYIDFLGGIAVNVGIGREMSLVTTAIFSPGFTISRSRLLPIGCSSA